MSLTPRIDRHERNWIINGMMDFWQRGTSGLPVNGYVADRWKQSHGGGFSRTWTRSTDVPPFSLSGFNSVYSMKLDCTVIDASVGSSDFQTLYQAVEGYDFANLKNQKVTLSLLVKTNKEGTYGVTFRNASSRSYVTEMVIEASELNQWVRKNFVVTFDADGVWDVTTGTGVQVMIAFMAGSAFQTGSPGQWIPETSKWSTANQVNFMDHVDNEFLFGGAQLLLGDRTEAPFRRAGLDIQSELALCQRYLQIMAKSTSGFWMVYHSDALPARIANSFVFPIPMRTTPGFEFWAVTRGDDLVHNVTHGGWGSNEASWVVYNLNNVVFQMRRASSSGEGRIGFNWEADADF